MPIWIDLDKIVGLNRSTTEINNAIAAENAQGTVGRNEARSNSTSQQMSAIALVKGQLTTRLRHLAGVEVDAEAYSFSTQISGRRAAAIAVQLSPIDILVDDAVVVVENIDRIMAEEGESREATRKAMSQISGMIIGIKLVLTAFLFRWRYDAEPEDIQARLAGLCSILVVYVAFVGGFAYHFMQLPSSFLANEDQGFVLVDIQTPPEASANSTDVIAADIGWIFADDASIENRTIIHG